MNSLGRIGVAGTAATVMALGLAGPAVAGNRHDGHRLVAVGLTADHKLVTFAVDKPSKARSYASVKGLDGDKRLVGIDYRVQDGKLYGVGDEGGIYRIERRTGMATKVSRLTVALSGSTFGVDFNPAADRLRIVSDTGQNLRHNVNAGGTTVVDTALTYPPAPTVAGGITAAAYTNNDLNADTSTTLYDIDTAMDQLVLQSPANSGQLSAVGKLGVDARADAGFDIYSPLRNGRATGATGYAVLSVGTRTGLYKISLVTGRADRLGSLPTKWHVTDLAVALR
jgi:hypothetical protein